MSSLAKRSAKYYFKEGLKAVGIVLGIECLLVIEWFILGTDEEHFVDYLFQMVMSVGCIIVVMMNMMYSFYGPNWYDSMALSMGARRKDIFLGDLIKQATFVGSNLAVYVILIVIFNKYEYILLMILSSIVSFALGPVGLVIGHKVHNHGKVIVFIIAMLAGGGGGFVGFATATGLAFGAEMLGAFLITATVIGSIIIFALFEFWAYKLNQKSMVR